MVCEPRSCAICGREFTPKSVTNIYCSYGCAKEANRRYARMLARKNAKKAQADTFDGGLDPDESAMQAVWALDDETRKRLRLLFAPRIRDAVRMWMEDSE